MPGEVKKIKALHENIWAKLCNVARKSGVKVTPISLYIPCKIDADCSILKLPTPIHIKELIYEARKVDIAIYGYEIYKENAPLEFCTTIAYFELNSDRSALLNYHGLRFDYMPRFQDEPICHVHFNEKLNAELLPEELKNLYVTFSANATNYNLNHIHVPCAKMSFFSLFFMIAREHFAKSGNSQTAYAESFRDVKKQLHQMTQLLPEERFQIFAENKDLSAWQFYNWQ